jgi:hypothetical protein
MMEQDDQRGLGMEAAELKIAANCTKYSEHEFGHMSL